MESPLEEQHNHRPVSNDPDNLESMALKHADSDSVNSIPPPPPPMGMVVPVASEESDDLTEAERLRQQQELDQQILQQQQEEEQQQHHYHHQQHPHHHQEQEEQQQDEDDEDEFHHQQQMVLVEADQQEQHHLVQSDTSLKKEKSIGASDNCCDKFLKCLGLIPCPTLLSWIVLLLGIGCLTGGLLVATWRTQDLIGDNNKNILWFMEYTIIGIVVGMFVVGTLLLTASHLSSEPTSRRVFNSFSKNKCAQGLNIFSLVLTYILTISWVLITAILTLPVMVLLNILYCADFDTLDLKYYGFNGTYTGSDLVEFKHKAEDLLISYGVALGAAIIIVNSLVCYIICISANISHLRDNRFATLNAYGEEEVRNSKHSVLDTNM